MIKNKALDKKLFLKHIKNKLKAFQVFILQNIKKNRF